MGDIKHNWVGREFHKQVLDSFQATLGPVTDETTKLMMARALEELPLRNAVTMGGGRLSFELLDALLLLMNGKLIQGVISLIRLNMAKKPRQGAR